MNARSEPWRACFSEKGSPWKRCARVKCPDPSRLVTTGSCQDARRCWRISRLMPAGLRIGGIRRRQAPAGKRRAAPGPLPRAAEKQTAAGFGGSRGLVGLRLPEVPRGLRSLRFGERLRSRGEPWFPPGEFLFGRGVFALGLRLSRCCRCPRREGWRFPPGERDHLRCPLGVREAERPLCCTEGERVGARPRLDMWGSTQSCPFGRRSETKRAHMGACRLSQLAVLQSLLKA